MRSRLLAFWPLLLLVSSVGLIVYGTLRVPAPAFQGRLIDLLPPPPDGWRIEQKPIASSPEMEKAVDELLNFDDGIFMDYVGPGEERISAYVAYWGPGRMSHRLVAAHTPDVCWVGSGWEKRVAQRLELFPMPAPAQSTNPSSNADILMIPPGEARAFTLNGTTEHVWFWHLVGQESKSYGTGAQPPWHAAITDLFRKGFNQREEQFFIRISSPKPLEAQMDSGPLPRLLSRIPWPQGNQQRLNAMP